MRKINIILYDLGIFIFGYILVYSGFILSLLRAQNLGRGDVLYYFYNFNDYLNSYTLELTHEPLYKIFILLASLIKNEYSIIFLLALITNILIFQSAKLLKINTLAIILFYILFPFSFNNPTNYLTTSWRSLLGIFFGISFCYSFYKNNELINIKKIILLICSIFSHSSGIFLAFTFLIYFYTKDLYTKLILNFKLDKKFLFLILGFSSFLVPTLIWVNNTDINYITTRTGQYINENSVNTKSLDSFLIKLLFLMVLEFFSKYFSKNQFSKLFHNYILLNYSLSLIIGFVFVPLIADRLVNSLYWISLLSLFDIVVSLSIKYIKEIRIS